MGNKQVYRQQQPKEPSKAGQRGEAALHPPPIDKPQRPIRLLITGCWPRGPLLTRAQAKTPAPIPPVQQDSPLPAAITSSGHPSSGHPSAPKQDTSETKCPFSQSVPFALIPGLLCSSALLSRREGREGGRAVAPRLADVPPRPETGGSGGPRGLIYSRWDKEATLKSRRPIEGAGGGRRGSRERRRHDCGGTVNCSTAAAQQLPAAGRPIAGRGGEPGKIELRRCPGEGGGEGIFGG